MSAEKIGCGFCWKKRRVLNVSELKIGQHICEPGLNKLKYKEGKHDLKASYFHHAIIENIKQRNNYEATLVLIHYADVRGFKTGSIQKKEEKRNLKYDEIYVIEYNYLKYTPKEIVRRAKSQIKNGDRKDTVTEDESVNNYENQSGTIENVFGNYNLFISNCEHFATWCVLGKQNCFQLDQKRRMLLFPFRVSSGAAGVFARIILNILGLSASIISEKQTHIPGFALFVVVGFYLIYLFYRLIKLYRLHKSKSVCFYCYEEKLYILATKFVWFLVSGSLSYMIITAYITLFPAWPVTILTNVIFLILSACIQWFYKGLKSPFSCKYIKVKQLSNVKRGEVIIFRQFGFKHFAITTKVTKSGKISLVHYKSCFFTRVIAEEEIRWPNRTIWRLDLRKMTVFRPEEIISRVRSRIGEKKWHWLSNRSDHVCYWAVNEQLHKHHYKPVKNKKTEVNTNSEQKILSSLEVETAVVHMKNECKIGDVVKFSVKNGTIKKGVGIIIEIMDFKTESGRHTRTFQLSLVMQAGKTITQSWIDIDLNTDIVEIKKFHPVHCYTMKERKNRAKEALHMSIRDKFKLVEFCVLKEGGK